MRRTISSVLSLASLRESSSFIAVCSAADDSPKSSFWPSPLSKLKVLLLSQITKTPLKYSNKSKVTREKERREGKKEEKGHRGVEEKKT